MADTSYTINFRVAGAGEVQAASAAVQGLEAELATASSTTESAAAAVATAEARYRELETAASKAATAHERIAAKTGEMRTAMESALAANDTESFNALAAKAESLIAKERELGGAAQRAAGDLRVQAAAVDALRAAAAGAEGAEGKLAAKIEAATQAQKKAQAAHDAAARAMPTGKVNDLVNGFKKLGGPVGQGADKIGNVVEGLDKLIGAGGGAVVAIGAAAVVVAALVVGLIALGAGIVSILKTTIAWADKTNRVGKAQAQLEKNLKKTFGGLKIDGVLDGLDTLAALFDANTASGRALKFLFETLFQPLVDGIAAAIPFLERLFIQAEILALKAFIALKPYKEELAAVGKAIAIVAAIIGGVLAAAVLLSIAVFVAFVGPIVAVIAALVMLGEWLWDAIPAAFAAVASAASSAWAAVTGAVGAAIDWIAGVPGRLAELGANMMQSLAGAITGAAGAVLGAITGAVGGAIDAAKALLGISSPSKVFAEIGMQTGAGMAGGVEDSTGEVQSAMSTLAAPPVAGDVAGQPGGAKGGSLAGAVFNFYGVKDAENAREMFAQMLNDFMAGRLQQVGG